MTLEDILTAIETVAELQDRDDSDQLWDSLFDG